MVLYHISPPLHRGNVYFLYHESRPFLGAGNKLRWLAKGAPLTFRLASRFFNRNAVAEEEILTGLQDCQDCRIGGGVFNRVERVDRVELGGVAKRRRGMSVQQPAANSQLLLARHLGEECAKCRFFAQMAFDRCAKNMLLYARFP